MNYEKKYNEALERAKELYSQHCAEWRDEDIEYIFPELVESEDEKIRKELLVFCRTLATGRTSVLDNNIDFNKWISWLEKQKVQHKQEWSEEDDSRYFSCLYMLERDTSLYNWFESIKQRIKGE